MNTLTKRALVLGPPLLFPIEVFRLAHQHSEGPFGTGLAIHAVTTLGGGVALVYAAVALWMWRSGRGHPFPWLLGASIAISPAAYFVIWNVFFRRT